MHSISQHKPTRAEPESVGTSEKVLAKTDVRKLDMVVLSVRVVNPGPREHNLEPEQIFADGETKLFTQVVNLAEKAGKPMKLLVVPGTIPGWQQFRSRKSCGRPGLSQAPRPR